LALQDSDNNANDKIVLTVGGKLGDYGVGFSIADNDGVQKIALNGSATFGATTVNAYIAKEDTAGLDMAYGIGASYDLGGASLVGGISHSEVGVDRADIGVSFSF
jgi:outer membrane protein OmpU